MSLTAIIIDDELKSRQTLRQGLMGLRYDVKVTAEADSVRSGIRTIIDFQPDIVFLDIQLSDGTGFDILEHLGEIVDFDLIFVTAYNQFALKAFEYSTVDYLVKPLHPDKLQRAVKKVIQTPKKQIKERLSILMDLKKENSFNKIGLNTQEGTYFVYLEHIIRCEGQSYYTTFFLTDGRKIIVSKTIKEYEILLQNTDFFRIHKSHIVNIKHIQKYKVSLTGGEVIMKNQGVIPIARRRKTAFLNKLRL